MRNDCIQVASFLLAEQDQDKEDGDDKFGEQIRKESEDMPPNLTAEASLKSKPMNNRRFAANSVIFFECGEAAISAIRRHRSRRLCQRS